MAYVLSSISGNLISAASAGYAPTNGADVSAIASSYAESAASGKVDSSAVGTYDYYGTALVTTLSGSGFYAERALRAATDVLDRPLTALAAESSLSSKQDASAMSAYQLTADMSGYYTTANESGYVDSAYVDSAVSGKQDTLNFEYNEDSAISSINGSALAGQGGGASIPFYGNYWDTATSATVTITADVASVGSVAYYKYDGTVVNTYSGITDTLGLTHLGVASFISPGAEINGKNNGGSTYTMSFAPGTSMWTTSDVATGIFAPLQYGTGAGMFMNNGSYKGYLKGNEWFVANTSYGYARGEVHNSRGCRVIVEHTGGAGAVLSAKNSTANVTLNSTARGTAKMEVANSQAYVQVQRGNADSKYNSAKLDTDYLKFYNSMTTGYIDPEDTASGTSYLPVETQYMYISSIPYWNAKLDTTAYNSSDFYSTSNPSGFIDSAYVDSAVSGKADSSALSSYVPYSSLEYNTASAISGINGSALAAGSTYSAGEGIDITDDVISVEAPVDIVAGPGIVIDNPDGNTMRISMGIAGSWIDVKTEASYNTTNINAGSFKIMYNPALNLVSLTCDANVGAGESTFFTWSNRLKPVFNDMALGSNLYVGQSGLKQAAGSTSRWINGAFMWPVVGGN